jgi:hypothetical protein
MKSSCTDVLCRDFAGELQRRSQHGTTAATDCASRTTKSRHRGAGWNGDVPCYWHIDQAPLTQSNLPAQWVSSDSTVVTIDSTTGIATCVMVGGPTNVTASAAGKGGTVVGSGTLICRVRSGGTGQCEVNPSTNTLTGACIGPDPQLPNHCRVATDDSNCAPAQPATNPVSTEGCLPPTSFVIDTTTACNN